MVHGNTAKRCELTNASVQKFCIPAKGKLRIYDRKIDRLNVIVYSSGRRSAVMRYRHEGVCHDYVLGDFNKMAMSTIRKKAKEIDVLIDNGEHPQGERMKERVERARRKEQEKYECLAGNPRGKRKLRVYFETEYKEHVGTLRDHKRRIGVIKNHFSQWFDLDMMDITPRLVKRWRNKIINVPVKVGKTETRKRTHAGVNRPVAYLKAMLRQAVEDEIIPHNPIAHLKQLPEPKSVDKRYLSEREHERLLKELQKRTQREFSRGQVFDYLPVFIELGIGSGLRQYELRQLKWSDINFNTKPCATITVRAEIAKSNRERTVPIDDYYKDVLKRWQKDLFSSGYRAHEYVFPSPVKPNAPIVSVRRAWESFMSDAEIENFKPKHLRKTFCSWLAQSGTNLHVVKELAGHSTVAVTEDYYAYLQDKNLSDAVSILAPK